MASGPLAGVRVVEFAGLGPAPFAGMLLGELGADVLKIDRPGDTDWDLPSEYDLLNRGRPSVCIDLKQAGGVGVARRLVDRAEVLVEGYRPGVMERLGLGPDALLARRPALVYGRMTGWGQDGPLAHAAGHDITYLAATGALHAVGEPGRPAVPLNVVGDFGGGALYLVVGVLSALLQARQTGRGQVVDAAIVDGAAHLHTAIFGMLAGGRWQDQRGVNLLDGGAPFYGVFATYDDKHVAVGPLEPAFYREFESLLDLEEPLPDRTDRSSWPALRTRLDAVFASRTRDEWAAVFEGTDACVAPVLSMTEAARHPQLAARGTLRDHGGVVQPAPAPRFSETPTQLSTPPPTPGQQSREALRAWGVGDIDALVEAGVVIQPPTD